MHAACNLRQYCALQVRFAVLPELGPNFCVGAIDSMRCGVTETVTYAADRCAASEKAKGMASVRCDVVCVCQCIDGRMNYLYIQSIQSDGVLCPQQNNRSTRAPNVVIALLLLFRPSHLDRSNPWIPYICISFCIKIELSHGLIPHALQTHNRRQQQFEIKR